MLDGEAYQRIGEAYKRIRDLIPELAKFGVVGVIGAVIDLGGTAALHGAGGIGPLTSKAIAVCVAMVVTYLGSRFWTFRHRQNQPLIRETSLFLVLNIIGLLIAEAVIAITTYGLGYRDLFSYNVASVIGTALGTIFRYLTYRKWVFLTPDIPNDSGVPVLTPGSGPPGSSPEGPSLLPAPALPAPARRARTYSRLRPGGPGLIGPDAPTHQSDWPDCANAPRGSWVCPRVPRATR